MHIHIYNTPQLLGEAAARFIAKLLNRAILERGEARLLLSTGASQFEMFEALRGQIIDWRCVEMFHLDEYLGLPESHPASFRKYLKERFIAHVPLKAVHLVDGEGDIAETLAQLNHEISKKPIDVGVIGIGENGHIAFNDPPADFETDEPYLVVTLDERCRKQQVGEGWFASLTEVPAQAVSMSVRQILKSAHIVSVVPHAVKAQAVRDTLTRPVSPEIPASILKTHADWNLFLDSASAQEIIA